MALSYSAPVAELAVELSEVRADAAALAEVFSQLNSPLPREFPREAVIELAAALHSLPDGTARGCLRPLTEAQSQLATVRSQYIRHDHPEEGWDIERPPLFRGEPVDQRLRSLMSSVSTALQTANRLAAEEPELESPEFEVEPPNDATTAQLIQKSGRSQQEIEDERDELKSLHIKSDHADTLSRRLTDAAILNQLGRGELRLPRIVSARLRRIANTLRDYPALLERAAELISTGTHFADYAHEKWSLLETRIFTAGTTTIREIADDISGFARKLEASRKSVEPTASKSDFDLEEAARMIHSGQAIPTHWRELVVNLPLGNRKLRSLAPLAGLVNLRSFTKASVRVDDISALAQLNSLQILNLDYTQVSDLSPISALFQLYHLSFNGTPVTNLEPLANLTKLRFISFSNTKVSDISALSELREAQSIFAIKTEVSDVSPLAQLGRLRYLDLDSTQIDDLGPLADLGSLEVLDVRKTKVKDLKGLRTLPKLTTLYLERLDVTDLEPISKLSTLQNLYASKTKISSIESLSTVGSISHLDLSDTQVTDLQPLASLDKLQSLQLNGTPVSDIGAISSCHSLRSLGINRTKVSDISSLQNSPITSLSIVNTPIEDLTPLLRLAHLSMLSIDKDLASRIPGELSTRNVRVFVSE